MTKAERTKEIYAKCETGEWLNESELSFAAKHGLVLWGCANYAAHWDAVPVSKFQCRDLTDAEHKALMAAYF